jgi:hypothetical protein
MWVNYRLQSNVFRNPKDEMDQPRNKSEPIGKKKGQEKRQKW